MPGIRETAIAPHPFAWPMLLELLNMSPKHIRRKPSHSKTRQPPKVSEAATSKWMFLRHAGASHSARLDHQLVQLIFVFNRELESVTISNRLPYRCGHYNCVALIHRWTIRQQHLIADIQLAPHQGGGAFSTQVPAITVVGFA